MVFCTYCGHSFTRDEHLERHILTHTNVKPFKCFTCHMSFARRDLLQRHYTVHGRTQDQQEVPAINGMIPKSAGRTPIACSNCAKTKTKCDKKFPCSRCSSRNLKCTLRPTRRSTKNAARMGLITAETLAQGLVTGELPPDSTIAAEQVPISPAHAGDQDLPAERPDTQALGNGSRSSSVSSASESSELASLRTDGQPGSPVTQIASCSTPSAPHGFSPTTPQSGMSFADAATLTPLDCALPFDKSGMDDGSPQFMLDWQQMQMPIDFDPGLAPEMVQPQDLDFDLSGMALDSQLDPMLAISSSMHPLMDPVGTQTLGGIHSASAISDRAGFDQRHRNISVASLHSISDQSHSIPSPNRHMNPIVTARDGWNVFTCTPRLPPAMCPTTARWNLESLEHSLKSPETWAHWAPDVDRSSTGSPDQLLVMQLHESSRDKLLAITQGFLHKTLEIHRGVGALSPSTGNPGSNFLLLPPTKILECLLRSYSNSFERYFQVTGRGCLDANELIHCHHDKASSLLILLMLAQGAKNMTSAEARSLTGGLIETCRISLFDMIEKNIAMASDHHVLHAALLFVELGSWSGDKWQMDIAQGQRGIYTAMLRHSGMLTQGSVEDMPVEGSMAGQDITWTSWQQKESRSRLVYSWALVDQEIALFYDAAPTFSVTELTAALPDLDNLWLAKSADEWTAARDLPQESSDAEPRKVDSRPLCLKEFFRLFLDDELDAVESPVTPLHLRLLLQPLQSMVCHYSQLMGCFSDSGSSRAKSKNVTASSTRCRLEEVQCLLHRWHNLAVAYLRQNAMCPVMQASLTMYHLVCLNTITDFPHIERLARREDFDGTYQTLVWTHKRCIADVSEALFHCGQVLRVIRAMPRDVRPSWWAAAIYRASLVLWCDSLITRDSDLSVNRSAQAIAIDALPHDHPLIVRYLNKGEGTPVLTKSNGNTVTLDHGAAVLGHCIDLIGEGPPSLFSEGLMSKLEQLRQS